VCSKMNGDSKRSSGPPVWFDPALTVFEKAAALGWMREFLSYGSMTTVTPPSKDVSSDQLAQQQFVERKMPFAVEYKSSTVPNAPKIRVPINDLDPQFVLDDASLFPDL
jgi:hypothetical protein